MGRNYKDGTPCKSSVDMNRSRLEPYEELANAIIIQGTQDYLDDYLVWFCTYPMPHTIYNLPGERYKPHSLKPVPVFQGRHADACSEIRKEVMFLHSVWFGSLTALNPTALHEGLRRKCLEPRYTRRSMEVKQFVDGKRRRNIHKLVEIVGLFEGYNPDGSFIVKSYVQYHKDVNVEGKYIPSEKHFTCYSDEPKRIIQGLQYGEVIAIEGETSTNDRYVVNVLNMVDKLSWKQAVHEENVMKELRKLYGREDNE